MLRQFLVPPELQRFLAGLGSRAVTNVHWDYSVLDGGDLLPWSPHSVRRVLFFSEGVTTGLSYSAQVLTDNPTFYWRLGETSGTTAVDSSGNGNTGTYSVNASSMTAAGLLAGDSDRGAAIQDPGHLVSSPVGASYIASAIPQFTFEIIYHPTNFASGGQIFGSENGAPFFAYDNTGLLSFSGVVSTSYGTRLSLNTTYHLCQTYDGATAKLYVNGVQVDSQSGSGSQPGDPSGLWQVGYDSDTGAGTYDEAAFYQHALSPSRVAVHAAAVSSNLSTEYDVFVENLDGSGSVAITGPR